MGQCGVVGGIAHSGEVGDVDGDEVHGMREGRATPGRDERKEGQEAKGLAPHLLLLDLDPHSDWQTGKGTERESNKRNLPLQLSARGSSEVDL